MNRRMNIGQKDSINSMQCNVIEILRSLVRKVMLKPELDMEE